MSDWDAAITGLRATPKAKRNVIALATSLQVFRAASPRRTRRALFPRGKKRYSRCKRRESGEHSSQARQKEHGFKFWVRGLPSQGVRTCFGINPACGSADLIMPSVAPLFRFAPDAAPAVGSMSYAAFAHLQADKCALYRAILGLFVAERARFVISLRPAEIHALLARHPGSSSTSAEIDAALQQLHAWGNVDDSPDNADAASIEEFYQRRRLYQLSAAGEAAEQALAVFHDYLHRPGELQTTALQDISELLAALLPRLADTPPDDAKLHHLLSSLVARFEQLTSRAQSFMRGLQSTVELHGISVEAFLAYKEKLIDYLEKFIGELVIATSRIGDVLLELEACGVELAFAAAARRDLVDALDPAPDAFAQAEKAWRDRWSGLRRWFIADDGPSQAELLRARARSAIPALLTAVTQINDRRASRADRAADFSALARWFAEAPLETDCHRLWRAAFALSPARHLRINNETLTERAARAESPRTSWLEGTPVWLSPRLRQHGQNARRGAPTATIDRSAEKARLRELAREQAAQIERARRQLIGTGRRRLSELGPLDEPAFRFFLELLGHALTCRTEPDGPIDVESADGTLRIRLDPIPGSAPILLATEAGEFRGRDHWLTIDRAQAKTVRAARFESMTPPRAPVDDPLATG